jgi:prepilin-type N-terminal cleavage/methylation domain-containing protein/prepilin-type processing-associated H-X9-DG protein
MWWIKKHSGKGARQQILPGFTLIELLVVIAIMALLMSILVPVMRKVREQAWLVACQSNLRQWCFAYKMYTGDNDGSFSAGVGKYGLWVDALRNYYGDQPKIRSCPKVKKYATDIGLEWYEFGGVFVGWGKINDTDISGETDFWYYGSYGQNAFLYNPPPGEAFWDPRMKSEVPPEEMWRTLLQIRTPSKVPMFFECSWRDAWPDEKTPPPRNEGGSSYCINRHNGYTNMAFTDFSVREVALRQLWNFYWHKGYDAKSSPWSEAGGVTTDRWPKWMEKLPED